jgi:predicted ester cyclase
MNMTVDEMRQVSQRVHEALSSRDWDALHNLMTPGLAAEFKASFTWLLAAFPDYSPVEEDVRIFDVDAQASAARFFWRGTHRGEVYGVAPTGKVIEFRGLAMERYVDGTVVESIVELNELDLLRQLGATKLPPAE